jgi:hypothetical protein
VIVMVEVAIWAGLPAAVAVMVTVAPPAGIVAGAL